MLFVVGGGSVRPKGSGIPFTLAAGSVGPRSFSSLTLLDRVEDVKIFSSTILDSGLLGESRRFSL